MSIKLSLIVDHHSYRSEKDLSKMYDDYRMGLLPPSPKENKVINPKVAYVVTASDIQKAVPVSWIKKNKSLYGEPSRLSFEDPVANLNWDYLYFVNSDVFRPAAIAFEKSERETTGTGVKASYTQHIPGTKSYEEFWEEEFRRIIEGYEPIVDGEPCGVRISGEYYFFLNYTRMDKLVKMPDGNEKSVYTFPDFLAMDYYYFKELEARENPHKFGLSPEYKKSMVVAKSRRKGFSYKAAAGAVWITAFNNNARVGIASEPNTTDATDAVKCARKCTPIIDHLTNFTPFGRKDPGDPKSNGGWTHVKMKDTKSYFNFTFGLENTKTREKTGRQSTIFTMSLSKDDAASGEGLHRLYFEEAGKTANLDRAWTFARESMKAGSLYKGIAIIFGTGGEMVTTTGKEGSSKPFSMMFSNPIAAEVADFENIYEYKKTSKKCGYFVADMWSHFGSYVNVDGKKYEGIDQNGNALFWVAELYINLQRRKKEPPNGKQADYNRYLTQRCKTPSEAFLVTSSSVFNTADLIARRNEIKMSKGGFDKFRTPGELVERGDGTVEFKPDLEGKLDPITSLDVDFSAMEGCLLIYQHPQRLHGSVPDDAYIITVDPIGKNNSGGSSLNAVYVFKTPKYYQYLGPERIVASYVGRKHIRPLDYLHRLLLKLSKYYNARITFENDQDGGILNYFASKNELQRLLPSPMMVTKKHLPNSKTLLRDFGHSMSSDRHKSFGEMYLNEWLDYRHSGKKSVDMENNVVRVDGKRNLDMLEDELLIEQLIHYSRDGNYDAVDSVMGGIIQFEERYSDSSNLMVDDEYVSDISNQLMDFYHHTYEEDDMDRYYSTNRSMRIDKSSSMHEDLDDEDMDISLELSGWVS